MQKFHSFVLPFVAAGAMLLNIASAQQTPASSATPSASGQTSSGQAGSGQASSGQASSGPAGSATPAKKPASSTTAKKTTTGAKTATPLVLKTDKEKQSYAMGMNLGMGLHKQGLTLDSTIVARGMRDAMAGGKTVLTEDEAKAAIQQLQGMIRQNMEAKAHEAGAGNRKEGDAFLAANKSKEGVVTLPSGLQYKILKEGSGPKPTASDTVSCNYRGTLIDGKEFDSSYKRGQPTSFQVGGVIKGWTEALQLMPVGSKWQLFVPADLAYGDRSPSPDIAPGDTLIFEVELLSIGDQKK
jgi:FKBP-type peptidyl-prolyl cis-trans isomerase FklB